MSEGLLLALKGQLKKQSKEARSPFKIENTERLTMRNPVNPGILQPKITLNGNKPSFRA